MTSTLGNNISEISTKLKLASAAELSSLIDRYGNDPRQGVQKEITRAKKRLEKEQAEQVRLNSLYSYLDEFDDNAIVIGLDEVGRGPVAGPLTVAAVALPKTPQIACLNDSKQVKAEVREELVPTIKDIALTYSVVHIPPKQIDSDGMARCLRIAFHTALKDACARIGKDPDAIFIDGNPLHIHPKERSVIKGDAKIACISAASILAKVTRDNLMYEADSKYPGYDFAQSKGYASPKHIEAIKTKGLTDFHRASFCQNFLQVQDSLF